MKTDGQKTKLQVKMKVPLHKLVLADGDIVMVPTRLIA
jgi:hypothetical protein